MSISPGPFFTCFLTACFLAIYAYVIVHIKKGVLYSGTKIVFIGIGLILIRMLLPFNFPFTITVISYKILPPINEIIFKYIGNTKIGLAHILFVIWAVITIIQVVRLFWRQMQYRACLQPFLIKDRKKYEKLFNVLEKCNADTFQICVVPDKISPAIFGIRNPILILPDYPFSEKELFFICRHEIEHCRNHDLWLKLFLDLVICTQWFNPLAYLMKSEFTLAFELSNDQMILKTFTEMERTEYAECVLKMVRYQNYKTPFVGDGLSFAQINHSNVKTRVEYIISKEDGVKKKKYFSTFINLLVVGTVLLLSLLYVPEAYCPEGLEEEKVIQANNYSSFFIKENGEYKLYMNGELVIGVPYIPDEMKHIPVVEKEDADEKES